ncbi:MULTISPECIES: XylR family transcriptional regulator [Vibrio]|jgi:LacI family transcriptional regulator|uniref:AraC family transcriptional regulator n=2 Tax=Vibrio TaxID=662 RepID=A0A2J8GQF0_VIBDI|nr:MULTISPECIES: DNA-binding transcriptional regulator [Vibrio]MCZ4372417.1 DNA-binding transcriptional regulator [Vibrio diazotrophicus]MDW6020135.1 DNA-binding transcriptional regulator [Vibrio plantisponsor]NNM40968.1 DNA-binding transcriptional regulator [Vibrio plantisponsor]PNH88255.1 XylR family transcriptional regulator [Vibrio diazotrophicus]RAS55010.1 AraC family transcriptional regulator [Vibrio diazotrophicus]
MNKHFRITLLFNANKVYDRQVIEGIGEYLQASQCAWDIFLEEDFTTHLDNLKYWKGDGIIADFDNPKVVESLKDINVPIVAVGGSYTKEEDYPNVPYVATDNYALVELAFQHLKQKGLENFAFYGIPSHSWKRWGHERETAFKDILAKEGYKGSIFRGNQTSSDTWQYDMNRLADWIQMLPTPTGIIAVTDSRARHILQVCEHLNIMVPDKISVIGIDNEELASYLTRVSLSSVGQGCKEMGFRAAKILHKQLTEHSGEATSSPAKIPRILVPPTKVFERQSTDFHALKDSYVIQAMHYIRHNACKGIKVDQVLAAVGISRSNLESRFKEECGHSIHEEIHNSKLKRACNLLKTTSLPISEIAELCGYPSLQYMYTVFKKNLDQTPKDYRNNASNED